MCREDWLVECVECGKKCIPAMCKRCGKAAFGGCECCNPVWVCDECVDKLIKAEAV